MFTLLYKKKSCFAVLLLICSCHFNETIQSEEMTATTRYKLSYPNVIDSLNLNNYYDSAKWYIYTINCDKLYLPKSDTSKSFTFGQLPLKFEDYLLKGDTLELHFWFTQNGEIILPSMTRDFRQLFTGVGFNLRTKKKIYMWSPSGFTSQTIGGYHNRYENSLQPEVLDYIIKNKDRLDSSFKILAELKGIFKL